MTTTDAPIAPSADLARDRGAQQQQQPQQQLNGAHDGASSAAGGVMVKQQPVEYAFDQNMDYANNNSNNHNPSNNNSTMAMRQHPYAEDHPSVSSASTAHHGYSEDYYDQQQQQQQQRYNDGYGGHHAHYAHQQQHPSSSSSSQAGAPAPQAMYPNGAYLPPPIQTVGFLNGNSSSNRHDSSSNINNGGGSGSSSSSNSAGVDLSLASSHRASFTGGPTSPGISSSPLSPLHSQHHFHPHQQPQQTQGHYDYGNAPPPPPQSQAQDQTGSYHSSYNAHPHASYSQEHHQHPLSPTGDHFYGGSHPIPTGRMDGGGNNLSSGSYSSSASSTHYPARSHPYNPHGGSMDDHQTDSLGLPIHSEAFVMNGNGDSDHQGYLQGSASSPPSSSQALVVARPKRRSEVFAASESPYFYTAQQHYNLRSIDQSMSFVIKIAAKIDRGFFLASNDWTCYRRNYFQLSASFSILGLDSSIHTEVPCLVERNGELLQVNRFLICIGAHIQNGEKIIELVQHTPKRDKGPQMTPRPTPVRAGGDLNINSTGNNPNVVTFERVQFKTATANNGKRRAAQQYYQVHVDLFGELDNGELLLVANALSAPLVVRGRSPGHYADNDEAALGAAGGPVDIQQQQHHQGGHHPYHPQHHPSFDGSRYPYRNDSISSNGGGPMSPGEYPCYPNYSHGSSYPYQSLGSVASQGQHDSYYDRHDSEYPTSPLSPVGPHHQSMDMGAAGTLGHAPQHPYVTPQVSYGFSPESVSPDMYSPPGFVAPGGNGVDAGHGGAESPTSSHFNRLPQVHGQGQGQQGSFYQPYPQHPLQTPQQQPLPHEVYRDQQQQQYQEQDHEARMAGLRIHSPLHSTPTSPGLQQPQHQPFSPSSGSTTAVGSPLLSGATSPSMTPRRQSFSSSMNAKKGSISGPSGGGGGAVRSSNTASVTRKARSISMSGISRRAPSKSRSTLRSPSSTTPSGGGGGGGNSVPATPTGTSNSMAAAMAAMSSMGKDHNSSSSLMAMKGLGITEDRILESPMEDQQLS